MTTMTMFCHLLLGELHSGVPTVSEPPSTELPAESPAAAAIRTVLTQAVAATAAAAAAVAGGTAAVGVDGDGGWAADLAARKAGLRARLARLLQVRMREEHARDNMYQGLCTTFACDGDALAC